MLWSADEWNGLIFDDISPLMLYFITTGNLMIVSNRGNVNQSDSISHIRILTYAWLFFRLEITLNNVTLSSSPS